MRRTYPYLANPYGGDMNDDAKRKAFFKKIDDVVNQRQYVRLTLLSWDEKPLKEVQGIVTSGTMTKDASSSVRRTMSLSLSVDSGSYDAADLDMDFSINKKVFVELGVKNQTGEYPDYPILWFPQGVMFILSCSLTSNATSGVGITLSLKDKMCMLNGDIGGKLPATTIFNEVDTQGPSGEYTAEKVKIHNIIAEAVNHFGGEDLNNILVEDVDQKIRRVVKWTGDNPLYLIRQADDKSDKATYEATLDKPFFADRRHAEYERLDISEYRSSLKKDLPLPVKKGYFFSGWFSTNNTEQPFVGSTGIAKAKFIPQNLSSNDVAVVFQCDRSKWKGFAYPVMINGAISVPSDVGIKNVVSIKFYKGTEMLGSESLSISAPDKLSTVDTATLLLDGTVTCDFFGSLTSNPLLSVSVEVGYTTADGTEASCEIPLSTSFKPLESAMSSISSTTLDYTTQNDLVNYIQMLTRVHVMASPIPDEMEEIYDYLDVAEYVLYPGFKMPPEKDGYVFAGWFAQNNCLADPYKSDSGKAYARFISIKSFLRDNKAKFYVLSDTDKKYTLALNWMSVLYPTQCDSLSVSVKCGGNTSDNLIGAFNEHISGYNEYRIKPSNLVTCESDSVIPVSFNFVIRTADKTVVNFSIQQEISVKDILPSLSMSAIVVAQNDDCGYVYDDFTYIGDLSTGLGDTVTTVLDKLVSYMGNYEYFYDEYGIFHFREIKNYVNTTFATTVAESMTANDYLVENTVGKSTYTFTDDSNLVSLTSNPQMNNIKNDYIVQGTRKGTSSEQSYPVRYHLAIDSKPVRTHLDENTGSYTYEPRDNFLIYIDPDTKYKVGIFPVFVGGELPDPGNFNVVYAFEDADDKGAVSKKFMYVSSSGEYKEVEAVAYYNSDSSVTGYPSQVTDGYIPKDWRTELYVRGFEAKNNGTDKGYYFEELEAGWPQIYDLEAQEFKGAGDAGTSVSALTDGNSFLDFVDPETSPLGKYSVNSIGRRSDIVHSDDVNCLFQPEIPEVVYVNLQDEDAAEQEGELNAKGEPWCQVKGDVFGGLATGGYKNGAFDQIKYELYTHTNYQRTLSMTALPAFYLEPNTRVTVSDKTSNTFGDFIVKNVTYTLGSGSTMSVTASEAFERF